MKMKQSRLVVTLLSALAVCSCEKKAQRFAERFRNIHFPVFASDGIGILPGRIGIKNAPAGVFTNLVVVASSTETPLQEANYIIIPEDETVREMIANQYSLIRDDPSRPNIPLFFLKRETFLVVQL